ncbi:MAG: SlyX family protein [Pseudomonadaceae bacterium]|jgi:SlyX protein|nr:SlyX family protein [Pseudomonadaceae bacterium]
MSVDARINELECRLSFQDDTIQSLNDVVVSQQRQIDRLQLQFAALLKRQDEQQSQFSIDDQHTPPPHY